MEPIPGAAVEADAGMEEEMEVDEEQYEDEFALDDAPEPESAIGNEFNALHPAGELPSRAMSGCGVFEENGARMVMRDLQSLDAEDPPALDVVGRVLLLDENGEPIEGAPPGPFVRLVGVREWSVEYDELRVTVWVSTATADYKLLSPAPLYAELWAVLQRKTALAARVMALLAEDATMTYKTLLRQCIRCNQLPDAIQFKQVRTARPPPRAHQRLPSLCFGRILEARSSLLRNDARLPAPGGRGEGDAEPWRAHPI